MKTIIVVLLFFFQNVVSQSSCTTFYFIRHAEKADSSQNPDLSAAGLIRAEKWKAILEDLPLDAIYTTDYKRTFQTINFIASSRKLTPTIYNPKTVDAALLVKTNKGKSVLVVGHSNSIPDLTNKMIGIKKYETISESVFGNLYIVTICEEKVVSNVLLKLE